MFGSFSKFSVELENQTQLIKLGIKRIKYSFKAEAVFLIWGKYFFLWGKGQKVKLKNFLIFIDQSKMYFNYINFVAVCLSDKLNIKL